MLSTALCIPFIFATGCGLFNSVPKTTCDEYAAQSFSEQNDTTTKLLKSHDLEPHDVGNVAGLQSALLDFCGVGASAVAGGKASRNGSSPISDAVNWDSDTWG